MLVAFTLRLGRAVAPVMIGFLAGCLDPFGPTNVLGSRLVAIELRSDESTTAVVEVGDTIRVTTFGRVDGLIGLLGYDRVLDASWRSSDDAVARVSALPKPPTNDSTTTAEAMVTGVRPGVVEVSARARGVTGTLPVRVVPPIRRIVLRSPRDSVLVGDTVDIVVVALDDDGVPIPQLPLRFEAEGGLEVDAWTSDTVRVVATEPGRAAVSARFRRATGLVRLVVTRRGA